MRNRIFSFLCHFFTSLMTIVSLSLLGCSSETPRQRIDSIRDSSRHNPAADYMDGFWLDYRSPPERNFQHWEFYYKHCAVDEEKPYPGRAEWMCTEPY